MMIDGAGFDWPLFNKYICLNYTFNYVDDEVLLCIDNQDNITCEGKNYDECKFPCHISSLRTKNCTKIS